MLLDQYEQNQLFFNSNFKEAIGPAVAYRGELVIKPGEVADAQGRRKPPAELLRQCVLLARGDELTLISGHLDELQHFDMLYETVAAALTPATIIVLFVVNIDKGFIAPVGPAKGIFIPMVQGMAWNELIDLVALEKSDFKGQSSAEKVVTLFDALKGYKPKFAETTVAEALKATNKAKRETHGAV